MPLRALVLLEAAAPGRAAPGTGESHPVLRRAGPGDLAEAVERELGKPFGSLVLELDALSRTIAPAPADCSELADESIVYLSAEDGGFARRGFWLQDAGGSTRYCDALYVDMSVDPRDLADGSFTEVFAHEMGHVFLRRLMGPLPATPSRNFHDVFAVTDYTTAFDEGFGIHFQAMAALFPDSPGQRARYEGRTAPRLSQAWFSRVDGRYRVQGVRNNLFAFEQIAPADDGTGVAQYWRRSLSPAFDPGRLRTGQAMLAAEGVLATLFYRLAVDPGLSGVDPSDGAWRDRALAHYGRLFRALHALPWSGMGDRSEYVALLDALSAQESAFGEAARRAFVATTFGASADRATARAAQAAMRAGAAGQLREFVPAYAAAQQALEQLGDRVATGELRADAALGNPLWLANPAVMRPAAPWGGEEQAACLNLNAASESELRAMEVFDEPLLRRVLEERDRGGPYRDLAQLQSRLDLAPAVIARLDEAARAFRDLGALTRS